MDSTKHFWFRKLQNELSRIKENIINAYFVVLRFFIPCKIYGIDIVCPLGRDDKDGCKETLRTGVITTKSSVHIEELLDCTFKSCKRHFTAKHNIHDFAGIEFTGQAGKYVIYLKEKMMR